MEQVHYWFGWSNGDTNLTKKGIIQWITLLLLLLFLCVHRITARQLWGSTSPLERKEQQPRNLCLWPTTPTECGPPWHTSSTFHWATSPPFNHIQMEQAAVCTVSLTYHPALLHHYKFMNKKKRWVQCLQFNSILTCEVSVTVYCWTQCIVSFYLLLAHLNLSERKRKDPSFWYLILSIILYYS